MISLDPHEYDALTRLDFWIFVQRVFAELSPEPFSNNFHIELLADRLDRIRQGTSRRIAIALPPRSLKSIIVSVALPAWLLGHDPSKEIICASYGQDLADKLATDCRQVMQSAWYRRLFPHTKLAAGRQLLHNFGTTAGGCRIATSVGGVLTGLGADVIIVDDPIKPIDALSNIERNRANDWARHTLFTRLNDKARGAVILVMQRLHEEDMIGFVCGFADFELLSFPAIAQEDEHHVIETPFGPLHHHRRESEALHPAREPLDLLTEQKKLMGHAFFSAQYLQSPTPPGGDLVKTEWFKTFDPASPPKFSRIIQSWDTASKANELADYSVCTTWGIGGADLNNRQAYLLHVWRDRVEYPDLKRKVQELAQLFKATTVLIEETASGIQLIQEFRYQGLSQIHPVKALGDKIMRMQAQTPMIEAGRVFIPADAPWLKIYLHELETFPKAKHDDQVDSTAQALRHIFMPTSFDNWMEYARMRSEENNR